jgi:hypothetical protein
VAEAYIGLHMFAVTWVMSRWPENDDVALSLDDAGWTKSGIQRAAMAAATAVLVLAASALWNRFVVLRCWPGLSWVQWLPWALSVAILTAGILGAIWFVQNRPYM